LQTQKIYKSKFANYEVKIFSFEVKKMIALLITDTDIFALLKPQVKDMYFTVTKNHTIKATVLHCCQSENLPKLTVCNCLWCHPTMKF